MSEFGLAGSALWVALGVSGEGSPAWVLAVEACRIADRLDVLAGCSESWGEARLQAALLRVLLESPLLRVEDRGVASGVDSLAARRAARRAAAEGSFGS